jgi:hypothetical protein
MINKTNKTRPKTKQLPTNPSGKKRPLPRVIPPKLNDKKIQDMLTGRKPVPGMKKKPKTGEQLKEAIRKKTGKYPNTAQ